MKLLLTSAGITTRSIGAALQVMVDKSPAESRVAYVPTAGNVERYGKTGIASTIFSLTKYGFNDIDIVDFTAAGVDWRSRLHAADVIYVGGGNTFHLLDQARQTGFDVWLRQSLENKVYVGSSAGSILVTPSIQVAALETGDENLPGLTDLTGLNVVGFEIEPHCDMMRFADVERYADTRPNAVYALDDLSAVQYIDGQSQVVSSGSWKIYP
jgi:dipeptidase E